MSSGFQQRALSSCFLTATLLLCTDCLSAQTEGQSRSVVIDTNPSPTHKPGQYFALIVGINDYQHLQHLSTPRNDAQELTSVLSDQYGFKTQLLLDATRDQIIQAFDRYRRTLNDTDSLLIYYAGHGYFDEEMQEAYWAPVDAAQDTFARWIIAEDVTGAAQAFPARHVLVISDSCYSGMLTQDERQSTIQDRANSLEKVLQTKSRSVMSSGANEPVADSDAPGHFSKHSVFANILLQDLSQSDENEFTAEQLYGQIRQQVPERAKQSPLFKPIRGSEEGGDFVFIRVRGGDATEGAAIIHSHEKEPLPPPINRDEEAVRTALDDYEKAYASMNVRELKKVWPSLSRDQEKAIKTGFETPGLKWVKVELRNRTLHIEGSTATAMCDQWMIYTIGGRRRPPQSNSVEILLSKNSVGDWAVNGVKGR
jgi:Caspase domain